MAVWRRSDRPAQPQAAPRTAAAWRPHIKVGAGDEAGPVVGGDVGVDGDAVRRHLWAVQGSGASRAKRVSAWAHGAPPGRHKPHRATHPLQQHSPSSIRRPPATLRGRAPQPSHTASPRPLRPPAPRPPPRPRRPRRPARRCRQRPGPRLWERGGTGAESEGMQVWDTTCRRHRRRRRQRATGDRGLPGVHRSGV